MPTETLGDNRKTVNGARKGQGDVAGKPAIDVPNLKTMS